MVGSVPGNARTALLSRSSTAGHVIYGGSMSEKTVYQPGEDLELSHCQMFAELLREKYEPSDSNDTIFTLSQLVERFTESFAYSPDPENLKSAMVENGFIFSLVPLDDDFKVGFAVKMK